MSKPVTICEILDLAAAHLKKSGIPSSRLDAEVLMSDLLDMERIRLYVNFDRPLTPEELSEYRRLLAQRVKRKPVAYLVGHKEFMSYDFIVDENVLIPRPDTELLVESAVNHVTKYIGREKAVNILELCTGSGAVAVSLALLLPQANLLATDINSDALNVAKANADKHSVEDRVHLLRSDMFDKLPTDKLGGKFDLIVANPPYLTEREMETADSDVVDYEPHSALYGGPDGLDFYRVIAKHGWKYIKRGGALMLEIGALQGESVSKLLASADRYFGIEIKKDYSGLDRVVVACVQE